LGGGDKIGRPQCRTRAGEELDFHSTDPRWIAIKGKCIRPNLRLLAELQAGYLVAMWSDTGGAAAYGDLSLRDDKLTFNRHRVAMSAEPKYRQEWLQVQPLAVGPLPSCVARSDKQKSLSTGQWQNRLVLRL